MLNSIEGKTVSQPVVTTAQSTPIQKLGGAGNSGYVERQSVESSSTSGARLQTQRSMGETSAVQTAPSVDVVANFNVIQSAKEQANQSAQAIRQLDAVSGNVDQMREKLTQIVKMYPPYPKDSSERAQLLNSIAGLRKLTDQLTVPPSYQSMVNDIVSTPGLGDINASDSTVASSLDSLNRASINIAVAKKQLFTSADTAGGSGIGSGLVAEQQSQRVGAALAETAASIGSSAGKSVIASLTM